LPFDVTIPFAPEGVAITTKAELREKLGVGMEQILRREKESTPVEYSERAAKA
jgi:hypothetical protein